MTRIFTDHTGSSQHAAEITYSFQAGSPRPAAGRGVGGEGLGADHFRQRQSELLSVRPPHPQPFSPTKPGEKGANLNCSRFIFSVSTLIAGHVSC